MLTTSGAFAKAWQTANESVCVTGNITNGANTTYTIAVYAPEKTYSNIDTDVAKGEENIKALSYLGSGITDENGEYTINFDMSGKGGTYSVWVYSAETDSIDKTQKLIFRNKDEFKIEVEKLNEIAKDDAKTSQDFVNYINSNNTRLGFLFEDDTTVNTTAAEILYNEAKKNNLDTENVGNTVRKYYQACLIAEIKSGEIADMFEYKEYFVEDVTNLNRFLNPENENDFRFDQTKLSDIHSIVKERNSADIAAFLKNVAEASVLATAKAPNGVENLRSVMNAFSYATELSADGYNDTKLNNAIGTYKTIADFKKVLDAPASGGNSGGGTGGGAGGISGAGAGTGNGSADKIGIEGVENQQDDKQQMPMDVYTDLDDFIWARNAIVGLTDRGILQGRSADRFEPGANVLREEFVKILVAAFNPESEEDNDISFADVKGGDWFYEYIKKAVNAGITQGYSNNVFGTGENITRQDIAVMIYRIAFSDVQPKNKDKVPFADFSEVSDYAQDAVIVLYEKGIINGQGDGRFNPKASASRAEAAKMVYEVIK